MRNFLVSIILGLSISISGCGTFAVHDPVKIEQMTPIQKSQAALDQVKAAVTVVNKGAVRDRLVGVYNDTEWAKLKGNLNDIGKYLREAQKALDIGDLVTFEDKKALADKVFAYVKAELIKEKGKE